ncbi:hypothetical protein GGGNBK_02110 [Sporosarcina sp. ANT_H38]
MFMRMDSRADIIINMFTCKIDFFRKKRNFFNLVNIMIFMLWIYLEKIRKTFQLNCRVKEQTAL